MWSARALGERRPQLAGGLEKGLSRSVMYIYIYIYIYDMIIIIHYYTVPRSPLSILLYDDIYELAG